LPKIHFESCSLKISIGGVAITFSIAGRLKDVEPF
jgi:hypothetical protein